MTTDQKNSAYELYELDVVENASARYIIGAHSAEEAKAKLMRGEWDHFSDLGHDEPDIIDVRKLAS